MKLTIDIAVNSSLTHRMAISYVKAVKKVLLTSCYVFHFFIRGLKCDRACNFPLAHLAYLGS